MSAIVIARFVVSFAGGCDGVAGGCAAVLARLERERPSDCNEEEWRNEEK
jgi:hypothetical protein